MGEMERYMPTYTIKNTKTDEEWDVIVPWVEFEKMLEENKDWKHVLKAPRLVDEVRDIFAKQPDSFKDLKAKMHKHAGRNSRIKV